MKYFEVCCCHKSRAEGVISVLFFMFSHGPVQDWVSEKILI